MQALVVYDTRFGNTEHVARVIAEVLSARYTTRVVSVSEVGVRDLSGIDLLLVGGPTQAHGVSVEMKDLLAGLDGGGLTGLPAATFDTRFRMPRWLTGSAARVIARRLRRAGCRIVVPPESFFVARTQSNPLLPGEIERARDWADALPTVAPQPAGQR